MSIFSFSEELTKELPLTNEQKKLIHEYCCLASLSSLSQQEAQRISDILEIAQTDSVINFWINEADHFLGHKFNLINENELKDFQAKLREYLVTDCLIFSKISLSKKQ